MNNNHKYNMLRYVCQVMLPLFFLLKIVLPGQLYAQAAPQSFTTSGTIAAHQAANETLTAPEGIPIKAYSRTISRDAAPGKPGRLSLSGLVWNDINGNLTIDNGETGTNIDGSLYVNLVDEHNTVLNTAPVTANGQYAMKVAAHLNGCRLVLATTAAGTSPMLPGRGATWVNTGESGNGSNAASQFSSPVGEIALFTALEDITCQNFGIERRPVAAAAAVCPVVDPGGGARCPVPALSGTDADDDDAGGVHTIRVQSLPAHGTLYYKNEKVKAGQTITYYNPGLLTVDPDEGAAALSFAFSVVDIAWQESVPLTVTMSFTDKAVHFNTTASSENCKEAGGSMICIYPNPVIDRVYISGSFKAGFRLRLLDSAGRVVYQASQVPDGINMKDMLPGTYLLQVEQADQSVSGFKIIKR